MYRSSEKTRLLCDAENAKYQIIPKKIFSRELYNIDSAIISTIIMMHITRKGAYTVFSELFDSSEILLVDLKQIHRNAARPIRPVSTSTVRYVLSSTDVVTIFCAFPRPDPSNKLLRPMDRADLKLSRRVDVDVRFPKTI